MIRQCIQFQCNLLYRFHNFNEMLVNTCYNSWKQPTDWAKVPMYYTHIIINTSAYSSAIQISIGNIKINLYSSEANKCTIHCIMSRWCWDAFFISYMLLLLLLSSLIFFFISYIDVISVCVYWLLCQFDKLIGLSLMMFFETKKCSANSDNIQ